MDCSLELQFFLSENSKETDTELSYSFAIINITKNTLYLGGNIMKKFILFSVLFTLTTFSAMADAVTYDTSEEIIGRIQMEMKHK